MGEIRLKEDDFGLFGFHPTFIRVFKTKIQNARPSPSVFSGKNPECVIASFVYVFVLWIFFSEIALGNGPKKWHIFLFSTAYFRTY